MLPLHIAGDRYPNCANPADKLPVVWGDFVSALTRDPLEPGGCLPTVLIDRLNWIYLLSDSTIADAPIEVYARRNTPFGTIVDPSLYTVLRGSDVSGTGHYVSAIRFHAGGPDPTEFEISWRGYGSIDLGQQLINDPVSMIVEMFCEWGNWRRGDFEPAAVARAQGIAAAYAIPVHWAFLDDQPYGQILTELFENYLADIYLTDQGQLAIDYNLWPLVPLHANDVVQPYLDAARDVRGDHPEDAVRYRLLRENLLNSVTIRWRHNWATNTQASEYTYTHAPSQSAYVVRRPRNFTLKGIRTPQHLYGWIQLFLSPLVENPAIVEIPLKNLSHTHMTRGKFIALNWSAGPDALNRGWTNRVLRVLETETDYLAQQQTLRAFDTTLSVVPPQAVPFRAPDNGLWYLQIQSEDGTLAFVSTVSFPWVSTGAERSWVTRLSPEGTTVYIYPSNTGVLTTALSSPGGTGDALPVPLIDWSFRSWDITVGASPTYAVTPRLASMGVDLITVP